jgi:hypothetical protein
MFLSAITFFACELLSKKNHGPRISLFCLFEVILYAMGHELVLAYTRYD